MEKALANQHRPAYTLRLYSYDLAKEAASMAGTLVRDMTEGSPTRRIVEFFFPLLFGLLLLSSVLLFIWIWCDIRA